MTPVAAMLEGNGLDPLVAGGKGSALDRLIALGVRVPPTGVITTAAFQAFAAQPEIAALIEELRTSPVPGPEMHAAHRERVDEVFLSVALPPEVAVEVDALVGRVGDGRPVAVRSSATAEDLESASFAGQYESYLNVDEAGAHDAVRLVWASLWYAAPSAYRRFRSIDEHDLTMAVVVMRMLDPSHAGVLFTVDPGGNADSARLEVVDGLGEQLVSGERTPDAYVADRATMIEDFGAISPPLADLAREGLRLEGAFGAPQDIEFAVDRDELYIVQARPITTAVDDSRTDDGFDFSCGDDTTYTTAGIAEMLPGVVPPLSWGVNSWLVENGFRYLFDLLGGGADVLTNEHALIGRFRGRAALNLDAMRVAAGSIPGGSPDELEQQYFGEAFPSDKVNRRTEVAVESTGGSRALQSARVLRARRKAAEDSEVVVQAVDNIVALEPDLASLGDEELLAYWNRVLHVAQQVVAVEVAIAAMAAAAYRGVEVFLSRYMGSVEASHSAQRLTATDSGDRRSRIALTLDGVTAAIASSSELRGVVSDDWEVSRDALSRSPEGIEVLDEFFAALRRAGSTGIFAGPTWDEVPQLAWMTVAQELDTPRGLDRSPGREAEHVHLERALVADSRWRLARFVTGQLVDVRRKFLRREAADAAEFLQRRERTKAAVLILGGAVRRSHLEVGRRLVDRRLLETAHDVEMLSVAEMDLLVGGEGPTLETIAVRRRRNREAEQSGALPLVWTGEPPEPSIAEVVGERFEGWSASPGRYEGPARVVDSPASSQLRRGDVLVATTTDASWAPLFMAAGAVVVEEGGPLSHAAIVARELGMPAVANVPGLINRLRQEEQPPRLIIDGTAGVVVVIPVEPPEQVPVLASVDGSGPERAPSGFAGRRLPSRRWDDVGIRLNVFVAGLMGAGAVMSVLVGLTESISSTRGRERLRRKAAPVAAMMAEGAINGYDTVVSSPTGLRRRRDYWLMALVLASVGIFLAVSSSDAYFSDDGSAGGWGLGVSGAVTLIVMASVAAVSAVRWPNVPPVVRRVAPGHPPRTHSVWAALSPRARLAVTVMISLVGIVALLVVFAESWVLEIDEWLYFDWLEAGRDVDRFGPEWFNLIGRPIPSITIAVAASMMALRCRVVAMALPAVIVLGGLTNLALSWLTHRARPPFSNHAGEFTSYPGGHSIQLPLLLFIMPLAVHLFTGSRLARNLILVSAVGVFTVAWIDAIRTGGHWPIDQVAGLLIAISLLVVVYGLAHNPTYHESCHACGLTKDD